MKRLEVQITQEKEIGSNREDKLNAAITYDAKNKQRFPFINFKIKMYNLE